MKKILIIMMIFTAFTAHAELRIGGLFAMSGPAAHIGKPSQVLAEDIINEAVKNGADIKFIYYDTQGQPQRALKLAKRLISKDKADLIIGPNTTGSAMAMAKTIEKAKITMMGLVGGTVVVEPVKPHIFKAPQSASTAVIKIFSYLKDKGVNKIGIIADAGGFGQDGLAQFDKYGADFEIVGIEKFNKGDTDMTTQLQKLLNEKPEAVVAWTIGSAGAKIARNLKSLNPDMLLIQSHGMADYFYIRLAGEASEDTVMPAVKFIVADQLPDTDEQKATLLKFKEKYGTMIADTSAHAVYAYDGIKLLLKAAETAKKQNIPYNKAMEQIKGYVGVTGVYNMSSADHCGLDESSLIMVKVKDGAFVPVGGE